MNYPCLTIISLAATLAPSDARSDAVGAVTRLYREEAAEYSRAPQFDASRAFAACDQAYTVTESSGRTKTLAQARDEDARVMTHARNVRMEISVERASLAGSQLTARITQHLSLDLSQNGSFRHLVQTSNCEDVWRRTPTGWKLFSSRFVSANVPTGKPAFKHHATQRESSMYKLLSSALAHGGYMANLEGSGALTCFNSTGSRLFTLPPRRSCSDEFQWYVERSLELKLKTEIQTEGTLTMEGGHRGFSNVLKRDVFFYGTSVYEAQNQIKFVYTDSRWD